MVGAWLGREIPWGQGTSLAHQVAVCRIGLVEVFAGAQCSTVGFQSALDWGAMALGGVLLLVGILRRKGPTK